MDTTTAFDEWLLDLLESGYTPGEISMISAEVRSTGEVLVFRSRDLMDPEQIDDNLPEYMACVKCHGEILELADELSELQEWAKSVGIRIAPQLYPQAERWAQPRAH